jgi:hypothetical protein
MTLSMTCDQFEDILPQLLDDDAMPVPPAARLHLEGCGRCKALYDDLTGIRTSAVALPPISPSRDLWAGIEARIRTPVVPLVEGMPVRRQRRQISLRSAAIAAGLLALVNAGVSYTYMYLNRPVLVEAPQPQAAPEVPAPVAMRSAAPAELLTSLPLRVVTMPATPRRGSTIVLAAIGAEPETDEGPDQPQQQPRRREQAKAVYDREITRLQAIVDSGRSRLDAATAAKLDRNLRIIDAAIEQCNQALLRDSTSAFLIESLNNVYQTKVKVLRIAAAAASRD